MNRYHFMRVAVKYSGGSIDASSYEDAIHAQAAEGWDLVQMFVENPAAVAAEYVLIFKQPQT